MSEATFNPGNRRLCPDGACIGVIGDDGCCPVCGTAPGGAVSAPLDANLATSYGDPHAGDDAADADVNAAGDDVGAAPDAGMGAAAGGFRPGRQLCDDGSCIGVIGDDGACSVCGRRVGF